MTSPCFSTTSDKPGMFFCFISTRMKSSMSSARTTTTATSHSPTMHARKYRCRIFLAFLQSQQVKPRTSVSLLACPKIQAHARQVINDGAGPGVSCEIDRLHVSAARIARVDARRLGGVAAKNRQRLNALLAACLATKTRRRRFSQAHTTHLRTARTVCRFAQQRHDGRLAIGTRLGREDLQQGFDDKRLGGVVVRIRG